MRKCCFPERKFQKEVIKQGLDFKVWCNLKSGDFCDTVIRCIWYLDPEMKEDKVKLGDLENKLMRLLERNAQGASLKNLFGIYIMEKGSE